MGISLVTEAKDQVPLEPKVVAICAHLSPDTEAEC